LPPYRSFRGEHVTESLANSSSLEAGTIFKLKVRILPFVWLLYIVAFLDRINIGFAALTMNNEQ